MPPAKSLGRCDCDTASPSFVAHLGTGPAGRESGVVVAERHIRVGQAAVPRDVFDLAVGNQLWLVPDSLLALNGNHLLSARAIS